MTAEQFLSTVSYRSGLIVEPNSGVIGSWQLYIHWVPWEVFCAK